MLFRNFFMRGVITHPFHFASESQKRAPKVASRSTLPPKLDIIQELEDAQASGEV